MTTIWQWVTCNSAGLQTVAALAGALIAFAGLIVLCIYARDTRTIAKSTINQSLDRFMPILSVTVGTARDGVTKMWTLQNQGYGPAVSITHPKVRSDNPQSMMPPVMHGGSHQLCEARGPDSDKLLSLLESPSGFQVDYASIIGERFRSVCRLKANEGADVEFEILSRPKTKRLRL